MDSNHILCLGVVCYDMWEGSEVHCQDDATLASNTTVTSKDTQIHVHTSCLWSHQLMLHCDLLLEAKLWSKTADYLWTGFPESLPAPSCLPVKDNPGFKDEFNQKLLHEEKHKAVLQYVWCSDCPLIQVGLSAMDVNNTVCTMRLEDIFCIKKKIVLKLPMVSIVLV